MAVVVVVVVVAVMMTEVEVDYCCRYYDYGTFVCLCCCWRYY